MPGFVFSLASFSSGSANLPVSLVGWCSESFVSALGALHSAGSLGTVELPYPGYRLPGPYRRRYERGVKMLVAF